MMRTTYFTASIIGGRHAVSLATWPAATHPFPTSKLLQPTAVAARSAPTPTSPMTERGRAVRSSRSTSSTWRPRGDAGRRRRDSSDGAGRAASTSTPARAARRPRWRADPRVCLAVDRRACVRPGRRAPARTRSPTARCWCGGGRGASKTPRRARRRCAPSSPSTTRRRQTCRSVRDFAQTLLYEVTIEAASYKQEP